MHRIWVVFLVLCLLTGAGWGMQGNLQAQGKGKPKKSKGKGEPSSKHTMQSAKIDYLYIEANTQYLEGNKAEAISLFKEVLGLDADNDAALYNIGRIYAELGDHENARRYCEQALAKNKEIYWYYSELVNAYDQGHMNDKALVTQEALVKKFPDDKNGLYDLAQRYIHVKRYQEALNTYTQLESHTGMNEEIVFRKHQLYMFLNQPEKALVELARLVKANPGEVRYHQARFDILTMMGKTEEALVVLEEMLKANPNDGFALFSLADHYRNLGDLTKSDEYLLRGFANKQVDMNAKAKIVGGLYQMAERDKAILPRVVKLSDMLLQAHPTSAIAAGIVGDVRQANGQPDSARAYYRRSIALDPANEKVWQELLFIDSELKDDAALHKDAEKALDYFPNQVTFLYFYGAGSERTGNEDEAIYAYEKLKKISSADKELKLQALMSLGSIYHKTEQFEKSVQSFDEALELSPGNPLVLNNYAYYLSLRNYRMDDAERMASQAFEKQPNSPSIQDTYGWILYLKGDLANAKRYIGKAVESDGGAEVLEHYGDVLMKLGEVENAKSNWQKALDQGATNFSIAEKLQQFKQP